MGKRNSSVLQGQGGGKGMGTYGYGYMGMGIWVWATIYTLYIYYTIYTILHFTLLPTYSPLYSHVVPRYCNYKVCHIYIYISVIIPVKSHTVCNPTMLIIVPFRSLTHTGSRVD